MKTAPLAVTAALLVAGVGAATAVAPASAADRPTTQTVTSTTDSADQADTNVADPNRFEFRINNASKSTHAPYIYESFRVMGNTPPDDYARVLPRQGITKQLKAKKESPLGYSDLRASGTGAIWVKFEHQYSDDDPTDYMLADRYTGGVRTDGTPVLRVEKDGSGKYVDLTEGQSSTTEYDMAWTNPELTKPMKVTITCNRVWQTPDGGPMITWFDVNITPPSQR